MTNDLQSGNHSLQTAKNHLQTGMNNFHSLQNGMKSKNDSEQIIYCLQTEVYKSAN